MEISTPSPGPRYCLTSSTPRECVCVCVTTETKAWSNYCVYNTIACSNTWATRSLSDSTSITKCSWGICKKFNSWAKQPSHFQGEERSGCFDLALHFFSCSLENRSEQGAGSYFHLSITVSWRRMLLITLKHNFGSLIIAALSASSPVSRRYDNMIILLCCTLSDSNNEAFLSLCLQTLGVKFLQHSASSVTTMIV